jgi:hypothetical protein
LVAKCNKFDARVENLEAYQKTTSVNLFNNNRSIGTLTKQQTTCLAALPTLATKKAVADMKIRINDDIAKLESDMTTVIDDKLKAHASELTETCTDRFNHAKQLCTTVIQTLDAELTQKCEDRFIHASKLCDNRTHGTHSRIAAIESAQLQVSFPTVQDRTTVQAAKYVLLSGHRPCSHEIPPTNTSKRLFKPYP